MMARTLESLDSLLAALPASATVLRARGDLAALRFHSNKSNRRPIVALIGGTGTGKSTLLNRLIGADISAANVLRTFTAGAVSATAGSLPSDWLGLAHIDAGGLPARGQADALQVVRIDRPITRNVDLIDTPDLDGDRPEHHAAADRVFRWADAVVFLVTPEKYQMNELLAYYRLARRYEIPAIFAMNKCQEAAVLEDYREILATRDWPDATIFAIPRDDAGYEPSAGMDLTALGTAVSEMKIHIGAEGLRNRRRDLASRVRDQVIEPLRRERARADGVVGALREMDTPPPGLDVTPATRQLQQRLQERSVLYLMGPGRILDRARQLPSMLARLPREIFSPMKKTAQGAQGDAPRALPDFPALLADQFTLLQTRIDDLIRGDPVSAVWVNEDYAETRIASASAGVIATEEMESLRQWLQQRWDAQPRDTQLLMRVLKHLPGGDKLTQWSEAAPYLLTIVVAAHHAFMGPVDLAIIGGYSLVVWITQRLSDEVASRTRQANAIIAQRFMRLAHDQISRTIRWIDARAAKTVAIERLGRAIEELEAGV